LRHEFERRDGHGAKLVGLDQRQRCREAGEAHGDRAGCKIGYRQRRTAIGHMQDLTMDVHQFTSELLRVPTPDEENDSFFGSALA